MTLPNGMNYFINEHGRKVCTGSQMGRATYWPQNTLLPVKLRLIRLRMVSGGDYDFAHAYWGTGRPLYWAKSETEFPVQFTTGHNLKEPRAVEIFLRADSRDDAKRQILEDLPNARFFDGTPVLPKEAYAGT